MIGNGCILHPFFSSKEENIISYNNFAQPQQQRPEKNNGDLVNEGIRFPTVLVIGPNGESIGIKARYDALRIASEMNLDLLCVSPSSNPPVCKILNYGKYRFEAQKKVRASKKNQVVVETKEIRMTPQIGIHDLETKVRQAIKFLQNGDKVKVSVRFRGRQLTHIEVGEEVMNKFFSLVDEYAIIEKKPLLEGKFLSAFLASKVKK